MVFAIGADWHGAADAVDLAARAGADVRGADPGLLIKVNVDCLTLQQQKKACHRVTYLTSCPL